MHSYKFSGPGDIVFLHNGYMADGDVLIRKGRDEILIPAQALIDFVAYRYVLPKKTSALEQAGSDELLGVE